MPDHLRKQIRVAVTTALSAGVPLVSGRVFRGRVYPVRDTELPGLLVYWEADRVTDRTVGAPAVLSRMLRLVVRIVARETADLDDKLDAIALQVEQTLAMPCVALAGLAKSIALVGTETELQGTAQQPTGDAPLSFDVFYMHREDAPYASL